MTDNTQKAQGSGAGEARYLSDRFQWAAPGDQQEDVWMLRFCDNDVRDAMWTGPDAEAEAWAAWNRHAPGYNCYVFRLAALSQPPEASEVEGYGLRDIADAAISNLEMALDMLAKAGRPQLAEIQRVYAANLRAAMAAHPPKASPMQAMTLVQARRIVDAVTEHCRGADFSCDMKAATKSVLALAQPAPEQK